MILLEKFGALGGGAETLGGMVLMTPTSIAYTGTSASIGGNGSVTFTACSTLSLNGVFNTDYDNYVIAYNSSNTTGSYVGRMRLRAAGTDATGANYTYQLLDANATTITGSRTTNDTLFEVDVSSNVLRSGTTINVYGSFLTQPTAIRSLTTLGYDNATLRDYVGTHSLSTSYDGITLYPGAGSFTGVVSVYGLVGT